jgi:hypothetical protein
MIRTPKDDETGKSKPMTFFLWLVGIYIALFGLASQRYENRVDVIEARINSIYAGLSTPYYKRTLGRIPEAQSMSCPVKPEILKPQTSIISLFRDTTYMEGSTLLKSTVEDWKDSLSHVNLRRADLSGTSLSFADLSDADLTDAKLSEVDFYKADLHNAFLNEVDLSDAFLLDANLSNAKLFRAELFNADLSLANLSDANLSNADLTRAELTGANLTRANLSGAVFFYAELEMVNFDGAVLDSADFRQSIFLDPGSLQHAQSLYNTKFDPPVYESIQHEPWYIELSKPPKEKE